MNEWIRSHGALSLWPQSLKRIYFANFLLMSNHHNEVLKQNLNALIKDQPGPRQGPGPGIFRGPGPAKSMRKTGDRPGIVPGGRPRWEPEIIPGASRGFPRGASPALAGDYPGGNPRFPRPKNGEKTEIGARAAARLTNINAATKITGEW